MIIRRSYHALIFSIFLGVLLTGKHRTGPAQHLSHNVYIFIFRSTLLRYIHLTSKLGTLQDVILSSAKFLIIRAVVHVQDGFYANYRQSRTLSGYCLDSDEQKSLL